MHDANAFEPSWVTDWSQDTTPVEDPIPDPGNHYTAQPGPAAPTAATAVSDPAPAPAPVTPQSAPLEDLPIHHRRGGGYLAVSVLVAIAFIAHYTVLKAPTATTAAKQAALSQLAKPRQSSAQGLAAVTTTLEGAQSYQAAHGTYAGWPAPATADALGTQMDLIYSQTVNGTCYYATVFPGQTPAPAADPTNLECSPAVAAQHREAAEAMATIGVTGASASTSSSLGSVASSLPLQEAATQAQVAAQGSHPSVTPTFPTPLTISVPGVSVVQSSPTSATLESTTSGTCLQVTIAPTGAIPTPTACS